MTAIRSAIMILKDSRLKIDRANDHISHIEVRVGLLHKTHASRVEIDPNTSREKLIHEFEDVKAFDDIALILGDAMHNLKCALDYAWVEIVQRLNITLPVDHRNKFPVRKLAEELEGWLTKVGINQTCPNLFKLLLNEVCPYKGGNNAIWPIHKLNNSDKHRLLLPVLSSGSIEDIKVIDENGNTATGWALSESFQRPPYIAHYKPGIHVQEHGKLTATILVENSEVDYFTIIPETLRDYSTFILRVIERFERFLSVGTP
jgi:hypothetical protein